VPIVVAIIAMQIACVVHCIRSGRNGMWIMAIVFFPVLGSLVYVILEVLPGYSGSRTARAAKAAAVKVIDPEREVRAAREALDLAATAANHLTLADALADQGKWGDAIWHYERAEAKSPARADRAIRLKLAKACFEAGRPARARELIESLPESASQSENDRANLLLARLLEEEGEKDRAIAIYADVGRRLPGAEAQCRQAALLIALGRRAEAMAPLIEAEKRARRMDRHERARDGEMYDWAGTTLAELRSEHRHPGS
jgi:hypothetical protein